MTKSHSTVQHFPYFYAVYWQNSQNGLYVYWPENAIDEHA